MTNGRQVPVETTEGWRPSTSGGERTLVALAVLALLVGGLIVAGNLLGPDDVASVASHSPQPTERPSQTPRPTPRPIPTPAPLELVLESGAPPTAQPNPTVFYGWVRARVELQIVGAPELGSAPVGVLAAGELISAYEDPAHLGAEGWVQVFLADNTPGGWIATRQAGADLADRYSQVPSAASGYISTLAAGPDGFVGAGSQPGTSAAYPPPMLINSADGARWHVASTPVSVLNPRTAVWGPAGWLLMSDGPDGKGWLSSSADGSRWTPLGALRAFRTAGPYPQGLAASDAGYLFEGNADLATQAAPLWFSADGVSWHEVHSGLSAPQYLIGGSTAGGFYASAVGLAPESAFSVDGVTWSPVAGGPVALGFPPVAVGGRWFAIETSGVTGVPLVAPRPWLGSVGRGRLSWHPMPGAAAFSGAVVTALVSTGDEAIAFGWDRTTAEMLTWTTTGSGWIRSALPVTFGGPIYVAAAGTAGVVAVADRPTAYGNNPIVWHRARDGSWLPEPDPVIARIPEPSLADCAPPPRDALAFLILDRATAPFCYGDTPITFRAWSTQGGGSGGDSGGTFEPKWLATGEGNQLFLSPIESGYGQTGAVLPPTLATASAAGWLRTWLEVAGHFDDPAAETCRYLPSPEEILYYYAVPTSTVNACRQQFVVSAVRVVGGP